MMHFIRNCLNESTVRGRGDACKIYKKGQGWHCTMSTYSIPRHPVGHKKDTIP